MRGFRVRRAESSDIDGIARGFARSTDRDEDEVLDVVRHVFSEGSTGYSGIVATSTEDEVVAHFGVSHVPIRKGDDDRTFGRFNACFLNPEYRVGGIHSPFMELQETFAEEFEGPDGLPLVYGIFDEADWWFMRYLCGMRAIGTGNVFARMPGKWTGGDREVEVETAEGIELDGPLLNTGTTTIRDASLVHFRTDGPWRDDQLLVAKNRGSTTGYMIVRDRGATRHIMDWGVADGDEASIKGLLRAACDSGEQVMRVTIWNPSVWTCHALYETGFRLSRTDGPFLAARWKGGGIKRHGLSVDWQVLAADIGVAPLPRMSVDEQVVRPPQPGTVSGRSLRGTTF